jgi:hypothetical protein
VLVFRVTDDNFVSLRFQHGPWRQICSRLSNSNITDV